jgi:hypothetical protein
MLSAHFPRHVGCFLLTFRVMLDAFCSLSTACCMLSTHFPRHAGFFLLIFHVMLVASLFPLCRLLSAHFPRHSGCFLFASSFPDGYFRIDPALETDAVFSSEKP